MEAFNQHAQPLEKKAVPSRVSPETSAIRRPQPVRNEIAEPLIGPSVLLLLLLLLCPRVYKSRGLKTRS